MQAPGKRRKRQQLWRGVFVLFILSILPVTLPVSGYADGHDSRKITVVSTNDFHGALIGSVQSWSHGDMVGGAAWLAGYLNVVKEENSEGFLFLDAGDMMQGTLISNYFQGSSTVDIFNTMGLGAMALGNHEFDWGQDLLQERERQAKFPFLAANIVYREETLPGKHKGCRKNRRPSYIKPFKIKEVNDIRVGIIGIANPETPTITNPANVADLEFTDPVQAVNDVLPKIEKEADLVVVVAHIGGFWPDFEEGIKDFACGLDPERVHLIVSGHTHSRIDDVICGIPVVQAYSGGTAFSRIDFDVDEETGEVLDYTMNSAPTTTYQTYYGNPASYKRWDTGEWVTVTPDPVVEEKVEVYAQEIDAVKNTVVGETLAPVSRDYRHESAMGDWVTDVMRQSDSTVDFALTNSGGLRADIDAGEVTFGEVFEALPFDNTLVVVELEGSEVIKVLEEGITGDHGVVQVSGLRFTFDYDAPAGSRIVGDVIDLSTGQPLEPNGIYQVAVNDFMANGGDGYDTLAANPQTNSYVLVRDLVVDWLGSNSPFTAPDPAVEQRMTTLGTAPN